MTYFERCPFCDARAMAPFKNLRDPDATESFIEVWTIHHHCRGIDIWVEGSDVEDCLQNWNRRSKSETESLRTVAWTAQGLLSADEFVSDKGRVEAVREAEIKLRQALGKWQMRYTQVSALALSSHDRAPQGE